ncbi:Protein kinase-like (PK-like) [Glarea lozoyensis ATCC 20868]|uniref:Protein kinase-like (PK-like) n=1 Tax=Glarea lozoyensis (strain ATCC 20868 / MF5171) TaxID=1116229 RepID=S3D2H4_GLAL2|nr:Protein kinase-like (PK-like) [Glarea lozoyensis ATCC 20868]EPE31339.1 Protein kinase-like (PK-like) [Glarea lozoyensis ATCC 20868]
MAQTEKPKARAASTDAKSTWSWRKLFGKDESSNTPPAPLEEDTQRPGIARRLSRKVVPGLPRPGTFKRQQSEKRDRLEPHVPDDRRTLSVDRRRNLSDRGSSSVVASSPRMSAPELLEIEKNKDTIDSLLNEGQLAVQTVRDDKVVHDYVDVEKAPSAIDTASISTEAFDEMILEELEKRWILNLSMHFRDKSKREKFFVTFAETPTYWRRVTVSLDYRNAPEGSLEEELLRTKFQRDKSARIYEAIRESLPDIQFYDTVTNLKLQTENERLHVHVVEDVSEIIQYPAVRSINHLNCRRIREDELVFDSHLSGFVYKVRVDGQVFIKKEIPGPDTVDEFLYEINALHQLSGSRSVIQFGGVVLDNKGEHVKGLLISFAEQGALIDVIYDGEGHLPWRRRERWARQIVQGLSEIHEAGFVQGDFTLSNIVIDAYDNAKIIDINRRGCPVGWEPPEVRDLIESNQRISMYIGVKSDLYQLGMVLYALATQHDEPETQRPLDVSRFPAEIPDYFLDICNRCLSIDPRSRSQASTLLKIFPEMEDTFHEAPLRPVPIVVDAQYVDEKSPPNGSYQYKSGIHSPPYSSSGMDRSINVHDYAVTDISDDQDFYPRRGRSPPAPDRTETAGTVPFFSGIPYPKANYPPPRTSILTPESTPLPDSSPGSEYLNDTQDGRDSHAAPGLPSPASSRGGHPRTNEFSADSSIGFDYVDFATRYTPNETDPMDFISSNASQSQNYPEHMVETTPPLGSNPLDEKTFISTEEPSVMDITASEQHSSRYPQGLRHTEQEKDLDIRTKFETEEPRATVADSPNTTPSKSSHPLYPAELTGVGGVHSDHPPDTFEIPPPASLLDDDFTNEMH